MLAEITAGYQSLKAAKEIVQGLNALKTEVAVNEAKVALQNLLLEAHQALFAAQEAEAADARRVRALEAEIVELKDWSAEAERYELADTGRGALAYRLKESMKAGEPEHWLCPTCFGQRKKSYLQPETYSVGRVEVLRCAPCKNEIIVNGLKAGRAD